MFYKFFVTTFLTMLIYIFLKAKPEWKDNSATTKKVFFCLVFMLVQSLCIASIAMIIYNMWE